MLPPVPPLGGFFLVELGTMIPESVVVCPAGGCILVGEDCLSALRFCSRLDAGALWAGGVLLVVAVLVWTFLAALSSWMDLTFLPASLQPCVLCW